MRNFKTIYNIFLLIVIRLFISYKFPCQSTVSPHIKIGFSGRTLYSILLLLSVTSYHLRPSSDGQKIRTTNSLRLPELPSHKTTPQITLLKVSLSQVRYPASTNSSSSLLSIPRRVLGLDIPSRAKPRLGSLYSTISPYKSFYPHREERVRRSLLTRHPVAPQQHN
jgi:hypothetical protein